MNNEFWMPAPIGMPAEFAPFVVERLTAREQAVLRRLMRRDKNHAGRAGTRGSRAALRQRRRVLAALDPEDLRSLVRIVIELGL